MKYKLAAVFLLLANSLALAQVSNQRDGSGNIVRNAGQSSPKAVNQGPANNGVIRNAPSQPSTGNVTQGRGTTR
jgi:hypothetical protein